MKICLKKSSYCSCIAFFETLIVSFLTGIQDRHQCPKFAASVLTKYSGSYLVDTLNSELVNKMLPQILRIQVFLLHFRITSNDCFKWKCPHR